MRFRASLSLISTVALSALVVTFASRAEDAAPGFSPLVLAPPPAKWENVNPYQARREAFKQKRELAKIAYEEAVRAEVNKKAQAETKIAQAPKPRKPLAVQVPSMPIRMAIAPKAAKEKTITPSQVAVNVLEHQLTGKGLRASPKAPTPKKISQSAKPKTKGSTVAEVKKSSSKEKKIAKVQPQKAVSAPDVQVAQPQPDAAVVAPAVISPLVPVEQVMVARKAESTPQPLPELPVAEKESLPEFPVTEAEKPASTREEPPAPVIHATLATQEPEIDALPGLPMGVESEAQPVTVKTPLPELKITRAPTVDFRAMQEQAEALPPGDGERSASHENKKESVEKNRDMAYAGNSDETSPDGKSNNAVVKTLAALASAFAGLQPAAGMETDASQASEPPSAEAEARQPVTAPEKTEIVAEETPDSLTPVGHKVTINATDTALPSADSAHAEPVGAQNAEAQTISSKAAAEQAVQAPPVEVKPLVDVPPVKAEAAKPQSSLEKIALVEPPAPSPQPVKTNEKPAAPFALQEKPERSAMPDKPVSSTAAVHPPKKAIDIDRRGTAEEIFGNSKREAQHEAMGIKISVRTPKMDVNHELEQGYNALIAGDTEGAEIRYRRVLEADPNNADALFALATSYHRVGQTEKAKPLYSKLLSVSPNHKEGLNNYLQLVADGAPDEALIKLKELGEKNPEFSPVPAQMAYVYQKQGNLAEAAEQMKHALTLSPTNMTYRYNLAILYDRQKDKESAMALYRSLLDAYMKGEKIPGDISKIQQRLTFLGSNK